MKIQELETIQTWFQNYVRSFADSNGHLLGPYQLKLDHSERVARNTRVLAISMGWSETDVILAETIGWLHDVGRFSQFREFGTFDDAASINHGARGARILQQEKVIASLDAAAQARILASVSHHNAKGLPSGLDDDMLPFVHLIRDADKLDIFYIVHMKIQSDGFQELPRMLPQVRLDGPLNPRMIKDFQTHRSCFVEHIHSLTDFLLMQLSWLYDIGYGATFRQIIDRKIIDHITEHLPMADPVVAALVAQTERYVRDRALD